MDARTLRGDHVVPRKRGFAYPTVRLAGEFALPCGASARRWRASAVGAYYRGEVDGVTTAALGLFAPIEGTSEVKGHFVEGFIREWYAGVRDAKGKDVEGFPVEDIAKAGDSVQWSLDAATTGVDVPRILAHASE